MKIVLSNSQILDLARDLATRAGALGLGPKMYPIPRGGVPAAYALKAADYRFEIVNDPSDADFFMDDIIDSGTTMQRWQGKFPERPFVALIDKLGGTGVEFKDSWIVFPWERADEQETEGIEDNIIRLLQYIGEDPKRGGLLDTPKRVAKAWEHWASGYKADIPKLLKTFEDGADGCDEMVVVKDIPFYTHCEHHMAPFFGTATIAYIPDGKIVGLSKLPRVVNAFARRLQVQERLTNQIADAIQTNLQPKGVGVVIRARHLCMESRGIQQQGHHTITSALRGVMRESAEARAEFLDLAR
jgi:GTP cyclohydrolase I